MHLRPNAAVQFRSRDPGRYSDAQPYYDGNSYSYAEANALAAIRAYSTAASYTGTATVTLQFKTR